MGVTAASLAPASLFDRLFAAMPLVAILRGLRPEEAVEVGEAIVAAGIGILEVPLNSPDPLESIARLSDRFRGRALVGAGTVYTAEEADAVASAGGQIVVSPNMAPEVIRRTKARGLLSAPGVMTPSEAKTALDCGADMLKLFPAEMIPPAAVKAVKAVLPPATRLVIVGGVTPGTMAPYLAAGAAGFGIGSSLYAPGRSAADVGTRAQSLVAALRDARG